MYKSSTASRARGEPTTPKFRPLELSPDTTPAATRSDRWLQPAAEPRHRTKKPVKSALKKMGLQASFPSMPLPDVNGGISHHVTGSSNDHKYNGFVVHPQPLGPPGVSGSPEQPTRPLGERDSNRYNPKSPGVQRPQRYLPDTTEPVIPPPPVHPAGRSLMHDEINRTGRESHNYKGKLSEKLPQNSTQVGFTSILRSLTCHLWPASSAEPQYEPISSRYTNYGATLNPRHPALRHGVPTTGYPIYASPYSSQYPQQPQYPYKGYPRRPSDVENYGAGLSDNEVGRPPLLPRPQKYMPDGYSSETGMRQYYESAYYGRRPAPSGHSERFFIKKEQQDEKEHPKHQQLYPQRHEMRSVQPPGYSTQSNPQTNPEDWIRLGDALRMQGCDMKGHRLPTADRTRPSTPRGWTEPSIMRGVALSWPILEYKQRRRGPDVKPMVFFDISQDPDGMDGRGIRLLSHGDWGIDKDFPDEYKNLPFSTAIKFRYIDMKCTAPELQPWNVIIEHTEGDGIQVIDFFTAIYNTYQRRLTRDELHKYRHLVNSEACQRAFKRRCQKAPGSTEYNERQGIRRVDLAGDKTLYLRLHCDPDTKRYEFDLGQQNQDRICDSQLVPHHA